MLSKKTTIVRLSVRPPKPAERNKKKGTRAEVAGEQKKALRFKESLFNLYKKLVRRKEGINITI